MNNKVWNQFLIRFFLAFAFWEAFSFPVKILLFSKFYYNVDLSGLFVQMKDVYWVVPIGADFIQIFAIGVIYTLARKSLPENISGGVIIGLMVSLLFISIPLFMISFTSPIPGIIWWTWAIYQFIESITVSVIYSSSSDN